MLDYFEKTRVQFSVNKDIKLDFSHLEQKTLITKKKKAEYLRRSFINFVNLYNTQIMKTITIKKIL